MRSRKAEALRKAYAKYGDRVDIVVVEDLIKGDFTNALRGVSAVIHAASPAAGREELKDILEVGGLPPRFSDLEFTRAHSRSPGKEHLTSSARLLPQVSNTSPLLELSAPFWTLPTRLSRHL